MKVCSKCLERKDLEEFYKCERGKMGRRGECKACQLARHKAYRNSHGAEVVQAQKQRYRNSVRGKEMERAYNRHYVDIGKAAAYQRRYCSDPKNYPKRRARWLVYHAVKAGNLLKHGCEVCGREAEAHHHDYSKPLDVQWLCPKHHAEEHRRNA